MGAVTVICSGKGGVGKSTTTVGLGRALAQMGRRVLMLDCDAGLRTLDRLTGIEENLVYDSSDIIKGNCRPIDAIYQVEGMDNLFVMPAPASAENFVTVKSMQKLVPILKKYFDHVLLDCAAGIGSGFKAATIMADRAVVVCTPDPVCVRSSFIVHNLLNEMGKTSQRLVINRFNNELFGKIKVLEDLDSVIDEAGIRLIGVVPEDFSLVASFLKGEDAEKGNKAMMAMKRIASRMEGSSGPIVL